MADRHGRLPRWAASSHRLRALHALAIPDRDDHEAIRAALLEGAEPDTILQEAADALTLAGFDCDAAYERAVAAAAGDADLEGTVRRPLFLYVFKQYDRLPPEPPLSGRLTWWYSAHDDFRESPLRYRYFHDLGLEDFWQAREFPPRCARDDSERGYSCS